MMIPTQGDGGAAKIWKMPLEKRELCVADRVVVLDVLGNTYDSDSAPDAVRVEIRESPASGTLSPQDNTYIIYRPFDNYHGTDQVIYEVLDEAESSGLTTLVITVESVNKRSLDRPLGRKGLPGSVVVIEAFVRGNVSRY